MKSGAYKGYSRNTRNYTLENNFSLGMHYSDKPIAEGEMRLLVNFDISSDRTSLKPRLGFSQSKSSLKVHTSLASKHPYVGLYDVLHTGEAKLLALSDQQTLGVSYSSERSTNLCTPVVCGTTYAPGSIHDMSFTNVDDYDVKTRYAYCRGFNNTYYLPAENGLLTYGEEFQQNGTFLPARELNASEAVNYGYNMLLASPYNFVDSVGAEPIIHGIAVYDMNNNICLDPYVNQSVYFVPNMTLPVGSYYYMWLSRTAENDNYSIIKAGAFDFIVDGQHGKCTNGSPVFNLNIPNKNYFLQLVLYKRQDFNEEGAIVPPYTTGSESVIYRNTHVDPSVSVPPKWYWSPVDQVYINATQFLIYNECPTIASLESSFAFTDNMAETKGPKDVINYDLSTVLGMTMWNKYLVMYAPENGRNILFLSAYNEPEFFPYPNNTDIFDEDIRYCVPYLNDLLVFTESQLYRLVFDGTGGWVKTMIQGNLNITDADIPFIQVVKNMVYFKSGDGYYMVVPKSSSITGELTLAPVSRPLDEFFKHFTKNIYEVIMRTYPEGFEGVEWDDLGLLDAYSYLNFEDIHNIYRIYVDSAEVTRTVTVDIMYNSVARHWRMYLYTSHSRMDMYTADATQRSDLMMIDGTSVYFVTQREDNYTDSLADAEGNFLSNYQLLDTGYHDYSAETKKRFRELQLLINNISKDELWFDLSYILDSTERIPAYDYDITTASSEDMNIMYLTRIAHGVPSGEERKAYANKFCIHQSDYPDSYMWKVRTGISGKGYTPRLQLRTNSQAYELLNLIWVYRIMYLR